MDNPLLILAGAICAFLYSLLCQRHQKWAFAILFAATPFQHDIGFGGIKFSVTEVLLIIFAGNLILFRRQLNFGPVLVPTLIYTAVCILSYVLHPRETGLISMLQMSVYLILAVYVGSYGVRSPRDVEFAFRGLILVGLFLGLIVIATRSMYLWGMHKNSLGNAFSGAFLASFFLWDQGRKDKSRRFYLIGMLVTLGAMLMVASRGAWLGTIVAFLTVFLYQRRYKNALRLGLIAAVAIPIFWTLLPDQRKAFATDLGRDAYNVNARFESIDYAYQLFLTDPLFGSGIGLRKEYDATNLMLSIMAETGVVGLLAFTALVLRVLYLFYRSYLRTRGLPAPWQALSVICISLFATKLTHGLVDHYWGRGLLALSWSGVGMAWALGRMAAIRNARLSKALDNVPKHQSLTAKAQGMVASRRL